MVLREKTDCPGNERKFSSAVIHPRTGALSHISKLTGRCIEDLHFILERIYKETFGSDLPKKPKPFRISLVITAVFLVWAKLVRQKVLSIIAGKAAEVLLSTNKKVGQNLGKSK